MKIWVIESNNGKYWGANHRLVSFGCSRIFKGEKSAKEFASKMGSKYPELGVLTAKFVDVDVKEVHTVREMIDRLNTKDEEFAKYSYNFKMVAKSPKYGYMNSKYHGYHTLEERFSSKINQAAMYKTFPEAYARMQINKAFVQIPAEHMVKMWVTAGDYKDEVEGTAKLNELISLYEGNDMEICFLA